ncbi:MULTISPECIES: hypothetical protein [Streptomyces]|uniref:Uncharacterized protein n=1 Tax=Streptomyces mutomycini TaxID=284036 RepID=A0ABW0B105_9ACTN|nr:MULTISPECIES: hypothetical protein [Streptomyces]KPC78368.1 hypothetical protein ADK82_30520 [Streptomyces sp. NRRL S-4]
MTPPPPSEQKPPLPRRTPRHSTVHPASTDLPQSVPPNGTTKVQEAVEARDALAAALTAAGVQLPAMDIRTPWPEPNSGPGDGENAQPQRYALVHLGICSAPVALALAAAIRNGTGK